MMSLISTISCLRPRLAALAITSIRGSKRKESLHKPKNLPQHLWDKKHLAELLKDGYTHEPLVVRRLGGRDPETRRRVNKHIGRGYKFDYFVVDFHRRGPTEPNKTYDERVC
jgi:hypothetical protein